MTIITWPVSRDEAATWLATQPYDSPMGAYRRREETYGLGVTAWLLVVDACRQDRCRTCQGRGYLPEPCTVCDDNHMVDPGEGEPRHVCEVCEGNGQPTCPTCEGSGYMSRSHLWPCGCLVNDAAAHRVGCPDYPQGVRP